MRKALGLVIPLGMEMFDIFAQGSPQGALAKEDHLLHRPDPALCIGIQVRAARGQHERLVLLFPRGTNIRSDGPFQCRERPGGLLRYYHQEAA